MKCRVGLTLASDVRSVGSNKTSNPRSPLRNASRSIASSAPAGYVLPPTVQSVRSRSSSHSRWNEAEASSGLSILTSLPSRRRNTSEVKKVGVRVMMSRSKPGVRSR